MQQQQEPKLIVLLAGTAAAASSNASTAAAAGAAWLQLSPDTMHQHRLHSQQMCLVRPAGCLAADTSLFTMNERHTCNFPF
jgi:hypothetical protein